jgi:ATP-dependent DNA helicase RecQ
VAQLIWGGEDVARLRGFIAAGEGDEARKADETRRMNALIAFLETSGCRRRELLRYFGDVPPDACGNCDNCLNPPQLLDATEAARKLLSAVYRTGQRFGIGHLTEVLLGKPTEKVLKFRHEQASVFGIGRDLSVDQWRSLTRQLEAMDALTRDPEHGGLALGPASRPILKGYVPIQLKQAPARREGRSGTRRDAANTDVATGDQALFDALRQRRRELAAAAEVPPYVVFHDATLREMARLRPRTLDALARVPGVGASKLERWGSDFLAVIARNQ